MHVAIEIKMLNYPNILYLGKRRLLDKLSTPKNLSIPIRLASLKKLQVIKKKITPSYKLMMIKRKISCTCSS